MKSLTLEHVLKHPEKMTRFDKVYIWSGQWRAWWRDGGHGYTDDIRQAGIFTSADAFAQTRHCGPEKKVSFQECLCPPNTRDQPHAVTHSAAPTAIGRQEPEP